MPLLTQMTQSVAQEVLESGRNAFVTGPPGAGKSWLIRQFVTAARRDKAVAVTASTGIAGTHIGGMTLHSWAGLGVRESYGPKDVDDIAGKAWIANRIKQADVLVIDEVSMLSVQTFEAADAVCRKVRRSKRPFGGLQVVLCGDFFQLPPVSRVGPAPFIYGCDSWHELDLAVLYLSEQFRQSDDALLDILTAMRAGEVDADHYESLQLRMNAVLDADLVPTRLYSHNVDVDRVNASELAKLTKTARRFDMVASGPPKMVEGLRASCVAPAQLQLKPGAAVMFVKNNANEGYVNGTLGTVVKFHKDDGWPVVRTGDGVEIVVEPQAWQTDDVRGRKVAEVAQVPLRLAWAISVHKSQGMSLTAAEMDLSKAFVAGLGYVALSRVTALAGIRLLGLNRQALEVSDEARDIDEQLQKQSKGALAGVSAGSEAVSLF